MGKRTRMRTKREAFLKEYGLPDKSYSIEELATITKIPQKTLQEVYNRGIGAYKTNPESVRMKGSLKKGVKAPMSKKLSKEQWAMARLYSFLAGNPKHDQDLRGGGLITELIRVENILDALQPRMPSAIAFYEEHKDDEPDMLEVDGLLDEYNKTERLLIEYTNLYNTYGQLLARLDEASRQDYKRAKKAEFTLSPEERKFVRKLKQKPLRPLPSIPEGEETPGMNRQDAVGMGKKIAFARKYLRGRGIRASQKNIKDIVTAMDVEGVVFES